MMTLNQTMSKQLAIDLPSQGATHNGDKLSAETAKHQQNHPQQHMMTASSASKQIQH